MATKWEQMTNAVDEYMKDGGADKVESVLEALQMSLEEEIAQHDTKMDETLVNTQDDYDRSIRLEATKDIVEGAMEDIRFMAETERHLEALTAKKSKASNAAKKAWRTRRRKQKSRKSA